MSKVIAFLPMRKGSQRVKNKNVRDFAGIKGGLTFIKISQLLRLQNVDIARRTVAKYRKDMGIVSSNMRKC